jgi:hypothetical protein
VEYKFKNQPGRMAGRIRLAVIVFGKRATVEQLFIQLNIASLSYRGSIVELIFSIYDYKMNCK